VSLPEPELGDVAEFIGAMALAAMGQAQVPGPKVPLDRDQARYLIGMTEAIERAMNERVAPRDRARVERTLSTLRMAFVNSQ
jgi:hypothetical protein